MSNQTIIANNRHRAHPITKAEQAIRESVADLHPRSKVSIKALAAADRLEHLSISIASGEGASTKAWAAYALSHIVDATLANTDNVGVQHALLSAYATIRSQVDVEF